jgi:hypothetical protein
MPDDKVQREIEEILARQEQRAPVVRMAPPIRPRRQRPVLKLSPGMMMFGGLVLVIAALILRKYTTVLAIAALCVFAAGYLWSMMSRSRSRVARTMPASSRRPARSGGAYWRGQPVSEIQPRKRSGQVVQFNGGWRARIRRFFKGK